MLMNNPLSNSTEGLLLADERFLRRIAHLYYDVGMTQENIATSENYSRQTISKALQKAKDRGIVRITVVPEERTGYLSNLARELRFKLGLEDLELAPGRNMDEVPVEYISDGVLGDVAAFAADYLNALLKDGDVLAVSGGKTIRQVVRYLTPTKRLPNLTVVPTIGFIRLFTNFGDPNLIAHDIANAYGAKHAWLPIPAIVETREQCDHARSLPLARDVLNMIENANVVITGLWPSSSYDHLVTREIFSQEQINAISSCNPVVDINHWVFNEAGECINEILTPPPYFLTGLEVPRLRDRIRQGKSKVILVAGASRSYIPGILAILRAGLVNILVTDHVTAEMLNEQL